MSKTYNFPLENKRFRRPRKNDPIFVYGAAGLLVLIGIILLILWLVGPNKPLSKVFATKTPTPTITSTPTLTFTPTDTPTITSTPSATSSPTPSAPYRYTVQEGDSLDKISKDHDLGDNGIRFILLLNPFDPTTGTGIDPTTQIVYPGLVLWLPYPGQPYPTSTPIPANIRPGTRIEYIVETGDTLAGIASKFNSREDDIQKLNKLDDPNAIYVGQQLIIPVNLVTPTATRPPTSTPVITGTPATSTPAITPTP